MGFYPVDPASGVYSFGSPQLRRADITLANGKKYKKNYITYADIMAGGTLEFVMGK